MSYAPHNENSRVKIPALVHFTRLGYEYVSQKNCGLIDTSTNIFVESFRSSLNRINKTKLTVSDALKIISEISIALSSNDLGRKFYSMLINGYNGLKLIDFDSSSIMNNSFQVVTELPYKNGNDEFRPDITVLINGMPLAFIEVKKPNNKEGIQAEYARMNKRVKNSKFKRFVNITQIMVFSNNRPYDDTESVPLEGAFYAASNYEKLFFSHFREEDDNLLHRLAPIEEQTEKTILKDTNLVAIKSTPEYRTNISCGSPTNSIITSLFSPERIMTILRYAIAYVERTNDKGITTLEKHLMRYPQFFATKAIEKRLEAGGKNGIIWHTQGSGKTALAFFNVRYLQDYYQKKGIIAKFFFVVDRLDLLTQAADEFRARGLYVEEVNSRDDFIKNIQTTGSVNNTGQDSITVVNIQKFSEESVAKAADYNVKVQRIYFLDEAHRSYKPTGSFLSNLISSDRNAVMIALTGTPLIGDGYNSKDVFGSYIHKYYYNRSIADGYTLRLIREGITTTYRNKLRSTIDEIQTIRGSISKKELYAHPKYVKSLVDYIIEDFDTSRIALNDNTIGGMIVCDSAEQAREIYKTLQSLGLSSGLVIQEKSKTGAIEYDTYAMYGETAHSAALILHDEDDTDIRREKRDAFKRGEIDFLIVYNMLLTGFDAPRLKKLYLGRVIREHSLLQALTRVNRPYNKLRFGYVVDFADIRAEFDKTNKAYFDELQEELGDEFEQYKNIFKTQEEIEHDLTTIKDTLFFFDTENAEIFSQQISAIDDKKVLLDIRHALVLYKELYNIAKLFGYTEMAEKFDLEKISALYNEVTNRINLINLKNSLEMAEDMTGILNLALDEIDFHFNKVSESELVIADKFREVLEKARREMQRSLDTKDPEYITLLEELQRLFKKKNIEELTANEMSEHIDELERIRKAAEQRNLRDQMLMAKYRGDVKYMRTHKRLMETPPPITTDAVLFSVLDGLKEQIDQRVLSNEAILNNEPYFTRDMFPVIRQVLTENHVPYTGDTVKQVGAFIANEYFSERNWAN